MGEAKSGDYPPSLGCVPISHKEARSIDRAISPDRMGTYLSEAGSNARLARELYMWDRELAAAMFSDIAILEVALRNAVDREATAAYGSRWWEDGGLPLDGRSLNALNSGFEALPQHVRNSPQVPAFHGKLIARLMFGFWRDLFDAGGYVGKYPRRSNVDYEDNWRKTLHRVFPGGKAVAREAGASYSRSWALRQVTEVHALRNRIGHHEPLVRGFPIPGQQAQRLTARQGHEACMRLARMLDRDLGEWIRRSSSVPSLLDSRPTRERRRVAGLRMRTPPSMRRRTRR